MTNEKAGAFFFEGVIEVGGPETPTTNLLY